MKKADKITLNLPEYVGKAPLAVAVSGGADSMVLLALCKKLGSPLLAVNIDHGIRAESCAECDFVERYCADNDIPYKRFTLTGLSADEAGLEERARKARYKVFQSVLEANLAEYLLTAHHADDNAETLLLNLFRGSALRGAGGISAVHDRIIRPLLHVSRRQIEDYARENNIPFVTDQSNYDSRYSRNFLRNEILPAIRARFSHADENISAFIVRAKEDEEFLQTLTPEPAVTADGVLIASTHFDLPAPLFNRLAYRAVKHFARSDITSNQITRIADLRTKQTGTTETLVKDLTARRTYDGILIGRPVSSAPFAFPFATGVYGLPGGVLEIEQAGETAASPGVLYADGDRLAGAVIRSRKPGDVFRKFSGGSKPLSRYLIDKKVSLSQRDTLPLICYNDEILVIAGVEIADSVRITPDTKVIVRIKFWKE